jgi:monoamine oxidase
MARTPLFKEIQRALKLASHLEAAHTKTAEGLERIAETHWSRRSFLGTATAATAGAALICSPLLEHVALGAESPKVVIVGAGTAGLTCAYRLQQRGINSRIIEASTRVGGRMFSLRNFFPDNQLTELGGEYIDSDHTQLRALAGELGLGLSDLYYNNGPNGHSYFFDNKLIPADADFIEMFRPVARAIKNDLDQMKVKVHGKWEISYDSPHGREIDGWSIAEWFARRGVTGLMSKVLNAAYIGEYGLELGEQSALNLLLEIGDEPPPDEFQVFGASDERFHISEGNDSVPTGLAQRLNRPVEFNTRLESIRSEGEGYRLSVRRDSTGAEMKADILVLALPFTILRGLDLRVELPAAKRRAIQELGYGTNAKLIAGFSRRVWEETNATGYRFDTRSTGYTFTDLEFQCCWETSRGQPGTHALLTNFAGGRLGANLNQGAIQERAIKFASQVDQVFPGTAEAYTGQAVRQHWPSSPFVMGSYTCYKPGQYSTLADWVATPVGNIFFAGEHTSVEFNGYMEGAVETGQRAAREVWAKLHGRKKRPAKAA